MDKQQLKARFFGMHVGCEVFSLSYNDSWTNAGCFSNVMGWNVVTNDGLIALNDSKLILRPLSSITDEEAIECAGIALGEKCHKAIVRHGGWCVVKHKTSSEKDVYIGFEPSAGVWNEFGNSVKYDISAYDYLRSRNFCLLFMGLDPVAEGWAILETSKNPGQPIAS